MKKIFTLFSIALVLFSCNSDDAVSTENATVMPDPTKLRKVVFFPETTYKKELDFYENGLVKEIRTSNDNAVQTFIYNSNNNLASTTITANGSAPFTINFTYDTQNHITFINGMSIQFDSVRNAYATANNGGAFTEYFLNNNGLFNHEINYFGIDPEEAANAELGASAHQTENNTTALSNDAEWSSTFSHDNKTNPLKAAFLPACKAIGLSNFGNVVKKLLDSEYNSVNNVVSIGYASEDPESSSITYAYNSLNLPVTGVIEDFYLGQSQGTRVYIKYYYQGETIPQ